MNTPPNRTVPRSKQTPATAKAAGVTSVTPVSDVPSSGFQYSRGRFEELVDAALSHAKKLGASDAGADASEGCGLSVSVRKGELENVERDRKSVV